MSKEKKWIFQEPPRYGAAGLTGDVVKMFRGELRPLPGFLAGRQPGASATLFVRELIQNSMDAHFEWMSDHPKDSRLDITFDFQTLAGKELRSFVTDAGLDELVTRANHKKLSGNLGLPEEGWIVEGNSDLPLRVLRVTESATTGMYGPWERTENAVRKMLAALLEFGNTEKPVDAGGSYGFGKTGLAKASRARIVIAYTCFEKKSPGDGATRRLYGVSYWGKHDLETKQYTGFGGFGEPVANENAADDGFTQPFVDDKADRIAELLGLDIRSVGGSLGCGTSFVIIDPDLDGIELKNAIEIYWWPALERNQLWTTIIDDGEFHPPRPKKDPDLKPFTEALEYSEGKTKPPSNRPCKVESFKYLGKDLGALGMVIDDSPGSWSFSDDLTDVSMAALVRKTGLVIKYETTVTTLPKVRGVFSADAEVNDILRLSEPKAHDEWVDLKDSDIPDQSRKFAKKVKEDVRKSLREFSSKYAPTSNRPEAVLKQFNSYFGGSKPGGDGGGGKGRDPWTIEFDAASIHSVTTGNAIFQTSTVDCGLSSGNTPIEVIIECGFGASEGDRGFSTLLLDCAVDDVPAGFTPVPDIANAFRGVLDVGSKSTFKLRSSEYDPEWSCGFQVSITPWSDWKKNKLSSGMEEQ